MVELPGFQDHLAEIATETDQLLGEILTPPADAAPGEARLWEAMRYATLGAGKRLRACLAVEGAEMLGVPRARALRTAASVECLHAYSLVHDDLPAMDDVDLRRGKPTTHKAFDDATAILAGDALQTLASEILADPVTHADGAERAELCISLATASRAPGMVGVQMIDIAAETAKARFDLDVIKRLQAMKTGALIRFAAESGAILARNQAGRAALVRYAHHLGLAFQIRDDLLDIEGDVEALGKQVRKDAEAGKATFVSELGIDGARKAAAAECDAAIAALTPFGEQAQRLREAAEFAIQRQS